MSAIILAAVFWCILSAIVAIALGTFIRVGRGGTAHERLSERTASNNALFARVRDELAGLISHFSTKSTSPSAPDSTTTDMSAAKGDAQSNRTGTAR